MATLEEVLTISQDRGFIGPGSFLPHIIHARSFTRLLFDEDERCLDIGAGGGFPGLVLALEDDREWVFLDAMAKRCQFLEEAVKALGLSSRVTVWCGRAEELAQGDSRETFDAVVARSFGPPPVVAECSVGYMAVGGKLIVSEPPAQLSRWDDRGLARIGLAVSERLQNPGMVEIVKKESVSAEYPRPNAVMAKRPLW